MRFIGGLRGVTSHCNISLHPKITAAQQQIPIIQTLAVILFTNTSQKAQPSQ